MSTDTKRNLCSVCLRKKAILRCDGCSSVFCESDHTDHREELKQRLTQAEIDHNTFRQILNEQLAHPEQHPLIRKINRQIVDLTDQLHQLEKKKQSMLGYIYSNCGRLELKLNSLTNELQQSRRDDDFVEIEIHQWNQKLIELRDDLDRLLNVSIRQEYTRPSPLHPMNSSSLSRTNNTNTHSKWAQNGITVVGGNGNGDGLNQIFYPWGICVDEDQTVYVADWQNHRIVAWKYGGTTGRIVAGGNDSGNRTDQLCGPTDVILDQQGQYLLICDYGNNRVVRWPRHNGKQGEIIISNVNCYGLAMDNEGNLYVPDCEKHEVRRWRIGDATGTIVAGGNGHGNGLDQLSAPNYIFVDQNRTMYVSDYGNHRIMKWPQDAHEGVVVAGGQGQGDSVIQLSYPYGVIVDQMETVYVADGDNSRVICWPKGTRIGSVVLGDKRSHGQVDQLCSPKGLSFDKQGNMYVAEWKNHRVQRFNINS